MLTIRLKKKLLPEKSRPSRDDGLVLVMASDNKLLQQVV